MKKYLNVIKTVAFSMIFCVLFFAAQRVLASTDLRNYQLIHGFYQEDEGILDAVYIGSSTVYSSWNSMVAWDSYGLAVWPFSSNDQPIIAIDTLVKEARKRQPDALIIVNLNSLEMDYSNATLHYLMDYLPMSANKLEILDTLSDYQGYDTLSERMEFIFPIVRFHERWDELTAESFLYRNNGMKGAGTYNLYNKIVDITDTFYLESNTTNDVSEDFPEEISEVFDNLLSYCEEENVPILFVVVPRDDGELKPYINYLENMLLERGCDVLDFMDYMEETGIDTRIDFYNNKHTNLHGSIKFTNFLSEYLIENYGLEDHRGDRTYVSWDEGIKKYKKEFLDSRVPDYALRKELCDFSLSYIENFTLENKENAVLLSWSETEDADGYAVFRKCGGKGKYELIAETEEASYADHGLTDGVAFGYTVAPYRDSDKGHLYGDYIRRAVYYKP